MPLIHVRISEGAFDVTSKRQMIAKLMEAIVSKKDENLRGEASQPVTFIVIEEVRSGDWNNRMLNTCPAVALALPQIPEQTSGPFNNQQHKNEESTK